MARDAPEHSETRTRRGLRRPREWLRSLRGRLTRGQLRVPRLRRWQMAALAVVAVLLLLWFGVSIASSRMYSAQMYVVEGGSIGIPPPIELDFGDLPRGMAIDRKITLKNNGFVPMRVTIVEWGNIRDFVDVSDAFFTLRPGEERTVTFTATSWLSAEAKKYSGKVLVAQVPWPFPW